MKEFQALGSNQGRMDIRIDADLFNGDDWEVRLSKIVQEIGSIRNDGRINVDLVGESAGIAAVSRREQDLDQLRAEVRDLNLQAQSAKNPFTTLIHVLRSDPTRDPKKVMAKLDTQSKHNWVSADVLDRLGATDQIEDCDHTIYQGAGGEPFQASGRIALTWYETVVSKTRETSFLVNSKAAPFDIILGWEWIKAEGSSAFAEPVLVIKEMDLTEGQRDSP